MFSKEILFYFGNNSQLKKKKSLKWYNLLVFTLHISNIYHYPFFYFIKKFFNSVYYNHWNILYLKDSMNSDYSLIDNPKIIKVKFFFMVGVDTS